MEGERKGKEFTLGIWRSGTGVANTNQVNRRRARLVLEWVNRSLVPSRYIVSHPSWQLSLRPSLAEWEITAGSQ